MQIQMRYKIIRIYFLRGRLFFHLMYFLHSIIVLLVCIVQFYCLERFQTNLIHALSTKFISKAPYICRYRAEEGYYYYYIIYILYNNRSCRGAVEGSREAVEELCQWRCRGLQWSCRGTAEEQQKAPEELQRVLVEVQRAQVELYQGSSGAED